MLGLGVKVRYLHSEVDTLRRVELLRELRTGEYDVLIGINLLREGLDLPEVSLVAILDADKEGFLRNERSLVQTVGRAARNINGTVIMYADKMTDSMQKTIDETARRRKIQIDYNDAHGKIPMALNKGIGQTLENVKIINDEKMYRQLTHEELSVAADPIAQYETQEQLAVNIKLTRKAMQKAAKELDFIEAARLRDKLFALEKMKK